MKPINRKCTIIVPLKLCYLASLNLHLYANVNLTNREPGSHAPPPYFKEKHIFIGKLNLNDRCWKRAFDPCTPRTDCHMQPLPWITGA